MNFFCSYLPLSLPTPQTRMVWIGWVFKTVMFSGSINLRDPSSKSIKRSFPWKKFVSVNHENLNSYTEYGYKNNLDQMSGWMKFFNKKIVKIKVQKHIYNILFNLHPPICQQHQGNHSFLQTSRQYIYLQLCYFFLEWDHLQISRPSPKI